MGYDASEIFLKLAVYADKHPTLRAGQIFANMVCHSRGFDMDKSHRCPFYIEDDEMMRLFEKMEADLS